MCKKLAGEAVKRLSGDNVTVMIVDIGSATSTTTTAASAASEVSHPTPTSPAPAPAPSAVADPITTPAALQEIVDVQEVEPVAEKVEDDQSNQDTPSETS